MSLLRKRHNIEYWPCVTECEEIDGVFPSIFEHFIVVQYCCEHFIVVQYSYEHFIVAQYCYEHFIVVQYCYEHFELFILYTLMLITIIAEGYEYDTWNPVYRQ